MGDDITLSAPPHECVHLVNADDALRLRMWQEVEDMSHQTLELPWEVTLAFSMSDWYLPHDSISCSARGPMGQEPSTQEAKKQVKAATRWRQVLCARVEHEYIRKS